MNPLSRLPSPRSEPTSSRLRRWRTGAVAVVAVAVGVSLGIGTVQAEAAPSKDTLDRAIREHRQGVLVIEARPGTAVAVEQVRHHFWFGAALANQAFGGRMGADDVTAYRRIFLDNFNCAVTENALKWHVMEPRPGQIDYGVVEAMLNWTAEQEIPLRGHNIYWGIANRVPAWQKSLDQDALREVVRQRALDIGRRYRGRFAEYDLNNEMIHGNYYAERLGPGITKAMADWVLEGDPEAALYLNDYDILTGRRLADYVAHIRELRRQGVAIAGLGVQGHLHGDTFDRDALQAALDELAQFRLPIRVTEFNMPGQRSRYYGQRGAQLTAEEEGVKAQELADYYRICFAHPAVTGILMWGFWEGANWIPVSSLYRRDWTPTPAAEAYRDLVFKEWWTRAQGTTDAQGRLEVRAFYGRHRVSRGSEQQTIMLAPAVGRAVVRFAD
ncbi:MAG: glycoside hydrolase [Verrucomicrobia bacterium]|nr:glycoside hydrolase [Verrucomicrobiota bacterium]